MQDQFGNAITCNSSDALAAYDRATDLQLHAWPGVFEAINEALAAAPDFALGHALHALVLAAWGARAGSPCRTGARAGGTTSAAA